MDSAVEFDFAREADRRGARTSSSRFRSATSRRSVASRRSGLEPEILEPAGDVGSRRAQALRLRDPPAAGARRRTATSGCSPPRAKGASASRSRGGSSTKRARGVPFDEMAVFVRVAARLRRPARARASRAPASRPGSIAAPAARIRPAARSSPSSLRRRAAVRGALRRVPVARAGADGRARGRAAIVPPPVDDLFSGFTAIEAPRATSADAGVRDSRPTDPAPAGSATDAGRTSAASVSTARCARRGSGRR